MKQFFTLAAISCCAFVQAQFSLPQNVVQPPDTQNEIFPLDIDGDGDLDILTTNGDGIVPGMLADGHYYPQGNTADNFRICVNDGFGFFTEASLVNLPDRALWHFGDIDDDSRPEFFYVMDNEIFLRHNDGTLNFGTAQLVYQHETYDCGDLPNEGLHFPDQIKRITTGDINNDGNTDLLFTATTMVCFEGAAYVDQYSLSVYALYGNGTSFDPIQWLYTTAAAGNGFEEVADLSVIDADGDGLNEMVLTAGFADIYYEVYLIDNPQGYYESSNTSGISEVILGDADPIPGIDAIGFSNFQDGLSEINIQFMGDFISQWVSTNVLTENISTARFDVIDLYQDGYGDFVVSGANGQLEILEHDENNQGEGYTSVMIMDTGIEQLLNMRSGDVTGDGVEDLILMNEGNVYVLSGSGEFAPATNVTLFAFYDENMNGLFDGSDVGWSHFPFELNGNLSFSNSTGSYTFSTHNGVFNFDPILNMDLFDYSTPSALSITVTQGMADTTLYLGIIPANDLVNDVEIYGHSSNQGCVLETETQTITITNSGNTIISGEIIYPLNQYYSYLGSEVTPTYVSEDTIVWEYTALAPGQSYSLDVIVDPPGFEVVGIPIMLTFIATILDEQGQQIHMHTDRHNFMMLCSHDPNDIYEKNGYTDAGFFLDGDTLDYTIRFQNNGNAPAYNIRLENQLSDLLLHHTIVPVASSHDFTLTVDDQGMAIFRFDNIMLPDSTSDEPGSHGFVRYLILPVTVLDPGTVIENTAGIYFDLNDPVITNTEINTVFDCAMMTYSGDSDVEICEGVELVINGNIEYTESLLWELESDSIGNQPTINWLAGDPSNYVFTLTGVNPLCTVSLDAVAVTVHAFPAVPTITQNGNTLSVDASGHIVWMHNNEVLQDGTSNTLEITETGEYLVIVESNGCASSTNGSFVFTGIEEQLIGSFTIRPNPMTSNAVIYLPDGKWHVTVTGMDGRLILDFGDTRSGTMNIEKSDLQMGLYFVSIRNGQEVHSMKLVVE